MSEDTKGLPGPVGYKRPPKAHQFKAGQSGNRKGRPKKPERSWTSRQSYRDFIEILNEEIKINVDGRTQYIPMIKVIFRNVVNRAAKNDPHALRFVAQMMPKAYEEMRLANPDFYRKLNEDENRAIEDPYTDGGIYPFFADLGRKKSRDQ